MGNNDLEWQRKYQKEWYIKNQVKRRAQIKSRNDFYISEFRKSKDNPCTDCGVKYPYYVMDFDHVGEKKYEINALLKKKSFKLLREELERCELVCSNCHRIRTFSRQTLLAQEIEQLASNQKAVGAIPSQSTG